MFLEKYQKSYDYRKQKTMEMKNKKSNWEVEKKNLFE